MLDRLKMSAHSMVTKMAQMDAITNNLANLNTKGYKREGLFVNELQKQIKSLEQAHFGKNTSLPQAGSIIDFTQGALAKTEQPFDVAISGDGLFTIDTPQGEAYTRDGRFTINSDGILTTLDGFTVLGQGGPVEIDLQQNNTSEIIINDQGEIIVDGNVVDTLKVMAIGDAGQFKRIGGNLYQLKDTTREPELLEKPVVKQGFLEDSNVNPVSEMVAMIDIYRSYQTNEKLLQSQDFLLNKTVNEIGRVN